MQLVHIDINCRFIPVYTGNIPACAGINCKCSVYPCVYREHVFAKQAKNKLYWFIPVYTGNIRYKKGGGFI